MGKAPRQSFHARKKPRTGRLEIPARPNPHPPATRQVSPNLPYNAGHMKQVSLSPPTPESSQSSWSAGNAGHVKEKMPSPPTPENSQSNWSAEYDTEQSMTAEQAIKMGWTFVNRRLENDTDEEDPTLEKFITLLRAVDNDKAAEERHHNQELLVATIASLTESIASMSSEVSVMKSDVVKFAAMEQRQAVLDRRARDIQDDMIKFTTMIQRHLDQKFSEVLSQLEDANSTGVISIVKLDELQLQMATSTSIEKACSSIEDIVAKAEMRLTKRMESVALKTAQLADQLAAVNKVGNSLPQMQKQLAAVANVGNELAGCITNELRDVQCKAGKLPKMASQLETVKFCVQLIAKKLNVPEVQAALASRSPLVQQSAGPKPAIQHAPGNPAGGKAVQPQAGAAAPYTPPPRAKAAPARKSRSLSGKQKTVSGTRLPSYGRMDQYVLKTGQASK